MRRFKNILYVAESSLVPNAFDQAVDLADGNGARLTVILVLETIPSYLTQQAAQTMRQARIAEQNAALDWMKERIAGRLEIETKVVEGSLFLEVIREVLRDGRDLVIKSAGGEGEASSRLIAAADKHLLRKCPCPVWLIKSAGPNSLRPILAAVDFNDLDPPGEDTSAPLNRMILELAASLAVLKRRELHVVHAWTAPAEDILGSARTGLPPSEVDAYIKEVREYHEGWLKQLMERARNWIGHEILDSITVELHLPKGKARAVIPSLAEQFNVDLLVMGTVARTGIPGLIIGNTAESVLSQIHCSVLAVKPPGFVTPVTLEE